MLGQTLDNLLEGIHSVIMIAYGFFLGTTTCILELFIRGPRGAIRTTLAEDELHPYIEPKPTDSRSPCPALNCLANHGYLPRDGKNITFADLSHAIQTAYNLTPPHAWLLAYGSAGVIGRWRVNLSELAMHNRIEHNASLIHKDAMDGEQYAPLKADPKLIEQMLDDARDGGFSIRDFARARVRREESPDPDIDAYHAKIALGEAGLAFLLFKDKNNKMPMASFKNWFIHERFPENWVATRERTLAEVLVIAKDMDAEMHKIRAAHQKPQVTR